MSEAIPRTRDDDITDKDLFGSIPRALDLNPFEGINLDEICVGTPDEPFCSDEWEYVEINPIRGIDIAGMSVVRRGDADEGNEEYEAVEIRPDDSKNCVLIFIGRLVSAIPIGSDTHAADISREIFKWMKLSKDEMPPHAGHTP